MPCTIRRLHPETPVGPSMIAGEISAERLLDVALVAHDDVVQAVTTDSADHAFREGVRLRRPWRRHQRPGTEPPDSRSELASVDGVAIVDEETRDMVELGGCLDKALGCPLGGRVLGHPHVDDSAPPQPEHEEDVEDPEPDGDDGEEVACPRLTEVVPDERGPALPASARQADGAILGDGPRRDAVSELGQLPCDSVLPQVRLSRHIRRIRARRSASIGGRPGGRWRQRQSTRHPARCHLMTVSGLTIKTVARRRRNRPATVPIRYRSNRRRGGRLIRRRRTMTCWRSTRFSATRTARGAATATTRSTRKRMKAMDDVSVLHHTRGSRPRVHGCSRTRTKFLRRTVLRIARCSSGGG